MGEANSKPATIPHNSTSLGEESKFHGEMKSSAQKEEVLYPKENRQLANTEEKMIQQHETTSSSQTCSKLKEKTKFAIKPYHDTVLEERVVQSITQEQFIMKNNSNLVLKPRPQTIKKEEETPNRRYPKRNIPKVDYCDEPFNDNLIFDI